MPKKHKVKAGETVTSIAAQYNIVDPLKIWNFGQNERLKLLRKKPDLLKQGDDLYIPDLELGEESGSTEAKHEFSHKKVKAKLVIVLLDDAHKPIANQEYTFTIKDKSIIAGNTDGSGKFEQEIDPKLTEALLKYGGNEIELKIGQLDPITTIKGVKQRLMNLGYKIKAPFDSVDDTTLKQAVGAFVAEYLPDKPAELNDDTRNKLEEIYGC